MYQACISMPLCNETLKLIKKSLNIPIRSFPLKISSQIPAYIKIVHQAIQHNTNYIN